MSQHLNRILKPLVYKTVLRHNNMVRWCSSMSSYPSFLLIDHIINVGDSSDGRVERLESYDEHQVFINDSKLVEEVCDTMNLDYKQRGQDIHMVEDPDEIGWVKDPKYSDNVCLYLNYISSRERFFDFPPLPKGSQIQNIAMSSRPGINNIEDWVVAVKYSGYKMKLYRHNKDLRWIDIETTYESISPYSSLMYSTKDQRFYVPTPGCNYLCSFDLNFKEKDKLEFVEVRKIGLPKYELYELKELSYLTRTDHMVESPSGEQFLISWYYADEMEYRKPLNSEVIHKTKKFMVFREDEELSDKKRKFMSHTEDIGDLCIFLGDGEALCVPASSAPGLKPNCIYFTGNNYGVFDITTQMCTLFYTEKSPLRSTGFPYWPHPLSFTPN
ncbi:hypothetical protein V5N11_029909 [Cardamine amara subsp. amara]|uniref:KIB1-4 beta-propeller domain-containing protein n=1 Tax=Cardamine amara subsp. amara TaxID=228776 RepID=A0ABD0ZGF5_CARAN